MKKLVLKFLLLFCFISTTISGELSVTYIKTFQNVFKSENTDFPFGSNHLSPTWGSIIWHSPFLENLYRYGNTNHAMVKLVHEMFFIHHDNVTFDTTYLPTKIATYLGPQNVGALIAIIENNRNNPSTLRENLNIFINTFEQANTPIIKENIKKYLEKELTKLGNLDTSHQTKTKKGILNRSLKKELQESYINNTEYKKFKTIFIESLIGAILEENHIYPSYLTTLILLAFNWKKSNLPQHFIDLLWGIYLTLNNKSILFNENINCELSPGKGLKLLLSPKPSKENFVAIMQQNMKPQEFDKTKYLELKETSSPQVVINNLENLALTYFGFDIFENPLPNIVAMSGETIFQGVVFPDCGETSLLNFFIALIFNPLTRTFDFSILEQIGTNPNLVIFFKTHNLNSVYTQQAHNDWANIVSNLPNINYCDIKCNINAGIKNMLNIILNLVPGIEGQNAKEKLESLKNKFNLEKVKITNIEFDKDPDVDENDKNVTLNIYIEKKEAKLFSINWIFNPGHFILEFPTKNESSIKYFELLKTKNLTRSLYEDLYLTVFLNLFGNTEVLKLNLPTMYKLFSLFMQNLRTPENVISFVEILVKDQNIPEEFKINLIRTLYNKKIPKNDYINLHKFWKATDSYIFKIFDPQFGMFNNLTDDEKFEITTAILEQQFEPSNFKFYQWTEGIIPTIQHEDSKNIIIQDILKISIPKKPEFIPLFVYFYQWIKDTLITTQLDIFEYPNIDNFLDQPIPKDPELRNLFLDLYRFIKDKVTAIKDDYRKRHIRGIVENKISTLIYINEDAKFRQILQDALAQI
ncbi:TPA: hypothetical protein DEO28_03685 [Candidatus Dependentiae bacterium]|nr:MAG: hypothetical protein UR14_C0007G0038 [candidate division TM6 bacterium GW2011_GWE2_31_21]KKP53601.1 MAG: hypothetical protein UR43_C0004G0142 [candidate division TM6 bacterium GW2011_GWF2_33_332]HBS48159.1 hypothetical protein [Candidatus Dependentiae bacterium]HBZ73583.1 hypothetical protein [Candidatus Dependentiae bacterium]